MTEKEHENQNEKNIYGEVSVLSMQESNRGVCKNKQRVGYQVLYDGMPKLHGVTHAHHSAGTGAPSKMKRFKRYRCGYCFRQRAKADVNHSKFGYKWLCKDFVSCNATNMQKIYNPRKK